jgi:hypothetical protein
MSESYLTDPAAQPPAPPPQPFDPNAAMTQAALAKAQLDIQVAKAKAAAEIEMMQAKAKAELGLNHERARAISRLSMTLVVGTTPENICQVLVVQSKLPKKN